MLDWEEKVFLGLKALYQRVRVRPARRRREAVRATLRDRRARLLLLGQMIAGKPLAVFETDEQVLCAGDRLFLPREWTAGPSPESNAAFYDVKTILGALAIRDGGSGGAGEPMEVRASRWSQEFPFLPELIESLAALLPDGLWVKLGCPAPGQAAEAGSVTALESVPEESAGGPVTEIEGRGQPDVEVSLAPGDDGDGADLPMHTFEKVETLEEAGGLSRKTDDEDELEEHAEALDQLDMRHVWRSAERPRSIYRSDLILDGFAFQIAGEGPGRGLPYPEWDCRRRALRQDWCFVQPQTPGGNDASWSAAMLTKHRPLIQRLRREFSAIISEWQKLRRQPSGSEFDLDALVDAEVQRRTGHTPGEAVYLDRHRALHDVAALMLMDQSYSTDAWIDSRRVLDTITSTLFCAGEVLDPFLQGFAVAAFSSNTRRSCRFSMIKDFSGDWLQSRSRLGALQPQGYTRIGPALRHAQELLMQQPARRKLIILITDGRPCDYDRYEGEYGIQDVKKAIETGTQHGITTHAFAVEKQACEFFPRMFTRNHFDIIPHPGALTRKLCRLFAKVLAG